MSLVDLDLSKVATSLLKSDVNFGYIQLKRETGGTFDPLTGGYTDGSSELLPLTGAVKAIPDSLYDGTRIKQGDVMVVIDNAVRPLEADELVIGGKSYTIIAIHDKNHSGVTQVYEIQGRI